MRFPPSKSFPFPALARHRFLLRSETSLQVSWDWAMQLRTAPPIRMYVSKYITVEEGPRRTVVAAGDAATDLAVGGRAGVLLDAGVGDAAGAAGDGATLVLASHDDAVVLRDGRNKAGGGEEKGGERQLHLGGVECWC